MPIIFPYKHLRGQPAPLIPIGIKIAGRWCPLEAYVDSGAAYTVLHAGIAEGIGFDYRSGRLAYLQVGDGSLIPVYLHDLELQLGAERLTAPVGFSDKLGIGFNLLGRAGIFERFEICFREKQGIISFEPT
jgi:hypothetical protein